MMFSEAPLVASTSISPTTGLTFSVFEDYCQELLLSSPVLRDISILQATDERPLGYCKAQTFEMVEVDYVFDHG